MKKHSAILQATKETFVLGSCTLKCMIDWKIITKLKLAHQVFIGPQKNKQVSDSFHSTWLFWVKRLNFCKPLDSLNTFSVTIQTTWKMNQTSHFCVWFLIHLKLLFCSFHLKNLFCSQVKIKIFAFSIKNDWISPVKLHQASINVTALYCIFCLSPMKNQL